MISVNGEQINFTTFPDGTTSFRYDPGYGRVYDINWLYDGDHECMLIWHLAKHIVSKKDSTVEINLIMPYIPNARMDRVKNKNDVFTLKWFSEFINSLGFNSVTVYDPHSSVSEALIDNIQFLDVGKCVSEFVLKELESNFGKQDVLFCYPDEGAAKRYSSQVHGDYVFGIKHRDWETGKILGFELVGADKVKDRTILIVDDICSRGGTFTHTAKALKDAGAGDIFLYVSHCENTIREGSVLEDGLITHVFTTESIFRGEHEKITVLH